MKPKQYFSFFILLFALLGSTTSWSYSLPVNASEGQFVSEADSFKDFPAKSLTIEHQLLSEGSQTTSEERIGSLVWFSANESLSEKEFRNSVIATSFFHTQDRRRLLSLQIFPFHFFW
ncbi:hypothetical protein [Altibacter lentus]|uniref:hypothetical protein n=1 Tax=Altibacter lentus TaxID=1223410 RepID=UPI000550E05B|nr:hypothetical protein [Altibacter lentus]